MCLQSQGLGTGCIPKTKPAQGQKVLIFDTFLTPLSRWSVLPFKN